MTDNRQRLDEITRRITGRLAPVTFIVPIEGTLAVALYDHAGKTGHRAETIIAEALRAYMGDGA